MNKNGQPITVRTMDPENGRFGKLDFTASDLSELNLTFGDSLGSTFAAVTRRRASGTGVAGGVASTNTNNSRNTANSLNTGIFGRGLTTNSVSSLVRLAMSSNFPSGLLNQVY